MTDTTLTLNLIAQAGTRRYTGGIAKAVIAGWTGRDREAMEKHIVELEEIGIARPVATPMYYRVGASRMTIADSIEVSGNDSSGEVEFLMLKLEGSLWVGVGSDHTDRKLETIGVAISKQLCDKPMSTDLWSYDEVADHWEALVLRAFIIEDGERKLYQEGPVTTMQDPQVLIAGWSEGEGQLADGTVMFCGTLAARGGIRSASRFEFELEDPILKRTLRGAYDIVSLPIAG